jgi:hypothetical protein
VDKWVAWAAPSVEWVVPPPARKWVARLPVWVAHPVGKWAALPAFKRAVWAPLAG